MTLRRTAEWLAAYAARHVGRSTSTPGASLPGRSLPSATVAPGTHQCVKADGARVCGGQPIPDAAASNAPPTTADSPNGNAGVGAPSPSSGRDGARSAVVPYERDVLAAILDLLRAHPRVAWAHRMNVGGVERENANGTTRRIRFAFKGCSDIIGQLRDGRFLAIEVKRPGGRPTSDQLAFLGTVSRNGGVAFVAWSVDDVARGLA